MQSCDGELRWNVELRRDAVEGGSVRRIERDAVEQQHIRKCTWLAERAGRSVNSDVHGYGGQPHGRHDCGYHGDIERLGKRGVDAGGSTAEHFVAYVQPVDRELRWNIELHGDVVEGRSGRRI